MGLSLMSEMVMEPLSVSPVETLQCKGRAKQSVPVTLHSELVCGVEVMELTQVLFLAPEPELSNGLW